MKTTTERKAPKKSTAKKAPTKGKGTATKAAKKAPPTGKGSTKKAEPKEVEPEKVEPKPERKAGKAKAERVPSERDSLKRRLVERLRALGAEKEGEAVGLGVIASELAITPREVYGLINGRTGKVGSDPRCLLATGHVQTIRLDGQKGMAAYLTKSGRDTDFNDAPFTR